MTAQAMIMPKKYFFDKDGNPLAFGKIYTYLVGTLIDKPTYTTQEGDVENPNPVILNGEGYASINIIGDYTIVVDDANDNNIWSEPLVSSNTNNEWVACQTAIYVSTVSFKMTGNLTAKYEPGRRVRIDNDVPNYEYSTIKTSSFASGETTVVIDDAVVAVGVAGACVSIIGPNSSAQEEKNILDFSTVQQALDSTIAKENDSANVEEYFIGSGGAAMWDYVDKSSVTINTTHILQCVGDVNLALVLRDKDGNLLKYGAVDGAADSSVPFQAAIDDVNQWEIPKDVTIFAKEIILKDKTFGRNKGILKLAANQPEWGRVFTNLDKVNGNVGVVIDNTGGFLHGNRDNQAGAIVQHFALFIDCRDFEIFGGKFGYNKADEVTPTNSPDGPFEQGVPFGEGVSTNPTVGFISYMGGRNNNTHDFILIDWAQEGISTRWNEDSSTTNFKAINGTESEELYYAPVNFGSRAGLVTVAINDQVLVQEFHEFAGLEQQPHLIYKALVSGNYDLSLEDYTDAARWTLVLRDITLDLGYTAARHAGAKGMMNLIAHGYAAYCRASSFSSDSPMNGMHDLYSYHNSFQPGVNFGHSNTGSDSSVSSNLTAINSGWAGGTGGAGYGINLVGATKGGQVSNFYICGAARNGVNQSDSGGRNYLSDGTVKWSAAGGVKSQSTLLVCNNVRSKFNVGDDFEAGGNGVIRLVDCEDSRGINLYNERVILTSRNEQPVQTLTGDVGQFKRSFRANFATSPGVAIATLNAVDAVSADGMIVTVTYIERNTGSGSITNQYAAKASFLVVGSGTARGIEEIDTPYSHKRQFRASWDVAGVLSIFLQDNVPADVAANNAQNSLYIEVQNSNFDYNIGIS